MKKLAAMGLTAAVVLAACGADETAEPKEATAGSTASETDKDVKKELMKFYMAIPNTINAVDGDLNLFEMGQAEGTLPEGEELQAMKDAAILSAENAADAVEALEIPAALEDQQEQIESAFTAMTDSYDMRAEALAKDASFEAADKKFGEADALLNELLVEQDLAPSSVYNEVSQ